jgi:hypothetical protein
MPFLTSLPNFSSHESHLSPGPNLTSKSSFLFGRKALQPALLSQFSRQVLRPWLDRFTEFLERFHLAHYILPRSVDLRDGGITEVLFVLFQALAAAEDITPAGRLLTTILSFHHQQRTSPATIVIGLMTELGLSDLMRMDSLEET